MKLSDTQKKALAVLVNRSYKNYPSSVHRNTLYSLNRSGLLEVDMFDTFQLTAKAKELLGK